MDYKAIYNTNEQKGVEYDFSMIDDREAVDFCEREHPEGVYLINMNTAHGFYLGDVEKAHEIMREYHEQEGLPY